MLLSAIPEFQAPRDGSFILFPKPFSSAFALSGLAIIGGVAVHSYARNANKAKGA